MQKQGDSHLLKSWLDDPCGFLPKEYSVICVHSGKISAGILILEHNLLLARGSGAVSGSSHHPGPDTQPQAGCRGSEVPGIGRLPVAAALHHPGWAGKQVEDMALGSLLCFHAGVSAAAHSSTGDLADACDNVSLSSYRLVKLRKCVSETRSQFRALSMFYFV